VAYFKILFQNFLEGLRKIHENPQESRSPGQESSHGLPVYEAEFPTKTSCSNPFIMQISTLCV